MLKYLLLWASCLLFLACQSGQATQATDESFMTPDRIDTVKKITSIDTVKKITSADEQIQALGDLSWSYYKSLDFSLKGVDEIDSLTFANTDLAVALGKKGKKLQNIVIKLPTKYSEQDFCREKKPSFFLFTQISDDVFMAKDSFYVGRGIKKFSSLVIAKNRMLHLYYDRISDGTHLLHHHEEMTKTAYTLYSTGDLCACETKEKTEQYFKNNILKKLLNPDTTSITFAVYSNFIPTKQDSSVLKFKRAPHEFKGGLIITRRYRFKNQLPSRFWEFFAHYLIASDYLPIVEGLNREESKYY